MWKALTGFANLCKSLFQGSQFVQTDGLSFLFRFFRNRVPTGFSLFSACISNIAQSTCSSSVVLYYLINSDYKLTLIVPLWCKTYPLASGNALHWSTNGGANDELQYQALRIDPNRQYKCIVLKRAELHSHLCYICMMFAIILNVPVFTCSNVEIVIIFFLLTDWHTLFCHVSFNPDCDLSTVSTTGSSCFYTIPQIRRNQPSRKDWKRHGKNDTGLQARGQPVRQGNGEK